MKVIDLFSGVGGFSIGAQMSSEKFNIILANEYDEEIARSYKINHPETKVIVGDIKEKKEEIYKHKADIIIGGPPCQGFSSAGQRNRKDFKDDPRNYLFREYVDIVEKVKPKYIFMENVPGITTMSNGQIIEEILNELKRLGYKIEWKVVNSYDFSVPQERKRFILFGSRDSKVSPEVFFENLFKKNYKKNTLKDAIGDLYEESFKTQNLKILRNSKVIVNNNGTNHSSKAIELMSLVRQGENKDSLIEKGYKISSKHSGAYGRSEWNKPCKTIITRFDTPSSGRYIHPELNRTFTPREGARIQSFPDSIKFIGSKTSIYKQIGNAVPPLLGKALFDTLKEMIWKQS